MADTERAVRIYKTAVSKDKALSALAKNPRGWDDAYEYAKGIGVAVGKAVFGDLEADDFADVLDVVMRAGFDDVTKLCRKVQRFLLDDSGLGLGILTPEYPVGIASEIALLMSDAGEAGIDYLTNMVSKEVLGAVDESIRQNFEAVGNMGLECKITRRYDDVGIHDGKDPCQWCLDREGTWYNYAEALADGAFQRHPGCGCVITYEVKKTRTWSNTAGKWHNLDEL